MLGLGQVLAGGILFGLFYMMLMPVKRQKEQADYANLHIKNLKILIKSAKKRMDKELKNNPPKITQISDATLTSRITDMPAAQQQQITMELSALIEEIKNQQLKAAACEKAIDTRYEPAKRVMREATNKGSVDTAFTSTQALLKKDIDCVKEASKSSAQLDKKFHERLRYVLR